MTRTDQLAIAAMRAAAQRGFDPYNSHASVAKHYQCLWRLNFYR